MSIYARNRSRSTTPQSQPIPGRESHMEKNAAGGYVFKLDPWVYLERFLILGTQGGAYYASEQKLTRDALVGVERLISQDGERVVAKTVEISQAGRAPRQSPAIWTLAACSVLGNDKTKAAANRSLGKVCRTAAALFEWAHCVKHLKGSLSLGRGQRKAIQSWYDRPADKLAYQVLKYGQRFDISHRDLLRLAKPGSSQAGGAMEHEVGPVLRYACGNEPLETDVRPDQILAVVDIRAAHEAGGIKVSDLARMIEKHRLTREMIPSEYLNHPEVWEALLVDMPTWAMVRNLGKMSAVGLLTPLSDAEVLVRSRLTSPEVVKKSRMHPAVLLNATKTYASGQGFKGSLSWPVASGVVEALETAMDISFGAVEPSGKRILIAVDGSGSMTWNTSRCVGMGAITAAQGASVLAAVAARREPNYHVVSFDYRVRQMPLTARSSYLEAMGMLGYGGGTDGSAPIRYARENRIPVDCFLILTDCETWAGSAHPVQELKKYRQAMGIDSKMVVVGMTATGRTFADPDDPRQMDVVGFDTAAPGVISDFCRDGFGGEAPTS